MSWMRTPKKNFITIPQGFFWPYMREIVQTASFYFCSFLQLVNQDPGTDFMHQGRI